MFLGIQYSSTQFQFCITASRLNESNCTFLNRRKNVFHLSEFSAKSENSNWDYKIALKQFIIILQLMDAKINPKKTKIMIFQKCTN